MLRVLCTEVSTKTGFTIFIKKKLKLTKIHIYWSTITPYNIYECPTLLLLYVLVIDILHLLIHNRFTLLSFLYFKSCENGRWKMEQSWLRWLTALLIRYAKEFLNFNNKVNSKHSWRRKDRLNFHRKYARKSAFTICESFLADLFMHKYEKKTNFCKISGNTDNFKVF